MDIIFYGVRGSLATPIPPHEYDKKIEEILARFLAFTSKHTISSEQAAAADTISKFLDTLPEYLRYNYGGNTSCVYVNIGGQHFVFDCGTGLRRLGIDLVRGVYGKPSGNTPQIVNIFMSHCHWDHMAGFPFFAPMFVPSWQIKINAAHKNIRELFTDQQRFDYFPVSLDPEGSGISFKVLDEFRSYRIGGTVISLLRQKHPNSSFAYRLQHDNKIFIYASDTEYTDDETAAIDNAITFFKNADLVIFDAQYTLKESFEKLNWGHTSSVKAVDIALKSGVKKLVFFHHEPNYSDFDLHEMFTQVCAYRDFIAKSKLELAMAREGLKITL